MKKMKTEDSTVFVGSAREIKSLWNALMDRSEELGVISSHCTEPKMRKFGSYGLKVYDLPEDPFSYRTVYVLSSDTVCRWLAEGVIFA